MAGKQTFETAMTRLEEVVRELEGGEVTLDGSIKLYEEGIKLVKFCTEKLDFAENTIKVYRNADGDNAKSEGDGNNV